MKSSLSTDGLFFNVIGIFSTVSLAMILFLVLNGALRGDFSVAGRFLAENAGIQPFIIFMMPVILVASPVWIIRKYRNISAKNAPRPAEEPELPES